MVNLNKLKIRTVSFLRNIKEEKLYFYTSNSIIFFEIRNPIGLYNSFGESSVLNSLTTENTNVLLLFVISIQTTSFWWGYIYFNILNVNHTIILLICFSCYLVLVVGGNKIDVHRCSSSRCGRLTALANSDLHERWPNASFS